MGDFENFADFLKAKRENFVLEEFHTYRVLKSEGAC